MLVLEFVCNERVISYCIQATHRSLTKYICLSVCLFLSSCSKGHSVRGYLVLFKWPYYTHFFPYKWHYWKFYNQSHIKMHSELSKIKQANFELTMVHPPAKYMENTLKPAQNTYLKNFYSNKTKAKYQNSKRFCLQKFLVLPRVTVSWLVEN